MNFYMGVIQRSIGRQEMDWASPQGFQQQLRIIPEFLVKRLPLESAPKYDPPRLVHLLDSVPNFAESLFSNTAKSLLEKVKPLSL